MPKTKRLRRYAIIFLAVILAGGGLAWTVSFSRKAKQKRTEPSELHEAVIEPVPQPKPAQNQLTDKDDPMLCMEDPYAQRISWAPGSDILYSFYSCDGGKTAWVVIVRETWQQGRLDIYGLTKSAKQAAGFGYQLLVKTYIAGQGPSIAETLPRCSEDHQGFARNIRKIDGDWCLVVCGQKLDCAEDHYVSIDSGLGQVLQEHFVEAKLRQRHGGP